MVWVYFGRREGEGRRGGKAKGVKLVAVHHCILSTELPASCWLVFYWWRYTYGCSTFYFFSPRAINPCLAQPEEANWSGSVLFVIQYVNLYQQTGSSNLIGWKLEVGVAPYSTWRVLTHLCLWVFFLDILVRSFSNRYQVNMYCYHVL